MDFADPYVWATGASTLQYNATHHDSEPLFAAAVAENVGRIPRAGCAETAVNFARGEMMVEVRWDCNAEMCDSKPAAVEI